MKMSARNTTKSLREKLSERTDDRHRIGTDSKERRHYADPLLGTIWVTVGEEIAHIEQTESVEDWVNYTQRNVGWSDCRYSAASTAEWLVSEVA